MKPIFKTSAIFACLALLFVACDREPENDTTEYAGDPVVGTSDIWVLNPGNGKFEIEWDVNDNSIITGCYLTWNDGGDNVGEKYFTAEEDGVAPLATINYVVDSLPAGSYAVTLTNTSDQTIVTSSVAKSVDVYDDDTYTETVALTEVIHNGTDAEIDIKDELPEDCVGIIVTYTKNGVSGTVSDLLAYDSFTTTATLSGADVGTTFSYVACFQPEIAMDGEYVQNAGTEDGTIPSSTPVEPSSVEVQAGDRMAIVKWEVANNTLLAGSQITYTNSGGTSVVKSFDLSEIQVGSNEYTLEGLTGGETYTVDVRNLSESEDVSRAATVENVSPYDYDEYVESCTLPVMTLTAEEILGVTYLVVQFTELGSVSCRSIDFVYEYVSPIAGATATKTLTEFEEPLYISNAQAKAPCYFVATFALPDNALDEECSLTSDVVYMDCIYVDE